MSATTIGRPARARYLWFELEDHFGLDPAVGEVEPMANRLVAWWAAASAEDATERLRRTERVPA